MYKRFLQNSALALLLSFSFHSSVDARQVEAETAKQVAANLMFSKTGKRFNLTNLVTSSTKKVQTDNIYYTFNFPSGGWAIISADDVAHPVVAFSFTGSLSPNEDHPVQFDQWMEGVKNQIHGAISAGVTPQAQATSEWSRLKVSPDQFRAPSLDFATVGPLLTTEWNQGTYYNELCPADESGPGDHVWAGCVAAAMSQVMKYHNFPATGIGSHSYTHATYGEQSADFGATTYDWASMQTPKVTSSNTDVATLLYHAGVSVDMDYSPSGSGASTAHAATSLITYFKYKESAAYLSRTSYGDTEWATMLRTEINNSRPVIYRGSGTGGHAFVCDGYNNDLEDDYFHFNWGWSGSYNGYFYLDALIPGSYDFTSGQAAVMGIAPTTDPNLSFPYNQSFESTIPAEWATGGERVAISTAEAHSGSQSLMLSTLDGIGYSINNATLHINVPSQGARLSFWVKRGYDPAASSYNDHRAILKTQFGGSDLHTFYDGDFNDFTWQEFTLDMTPWAGTNVKLFVEQDNSSSSYKQWTYLDDVKVTAFGDIDADGDLDLADVIIGLQVVLNLTPAVAVDLDAEVDNDNKIGMAEVIFGLQEVSQGN